MTNRPPDHSSRDAATHAAMMNLLYPKPGLPLELFWEYWSGGHTQISSRLPGIFQYFQHHLSWEAGLAWPEIEGLDRELPAAARFYGDAEITFLSENDLQRFTEALAPLMQDEQNVFRKTISYLALGGNATTLVDRIPEGSPNGDLAGVVKYIVYLQATAPTERDALRAALLDEVGPALAGSEHVLKVRLRIPEYYDNSKVRLSAPRVSNEASDEEQYQGAIEIAFTTPLELRRLVESEEWAQASGALAKVARAQHPLRVLRTYTVYNGGELTTAGLRTPAVAEQIRRLGAINQVDREVVELMIGRHPGVRG